MKKTRTVLFKMREYFEISVFEIMKVGCIWMLAAGKDDGQVKMMVCT